MVIIVITSSSLVITASISSFFVVVVVVCIFVNILFVSILRRFDLLLLCLPPSWFHYHHCCCCKYCSFVVVVHYRSKRHTIHSHYLYFLIIFCIDIELSFDPTRRRHTFPLIVNRWKAPLSSFLIAQICTYIRLHHGDGKQRFNEATLYAMKGRYRLIIGSFKDNYHRWMVSNQFQ